MEEAKKSKEEVDVGLCLRKQAKEFLINHKKKLMLMSHPQQQELSPSLQLQGQGGSLLCCTSKDFASLGDIYNNTTPSALSSSTETMQPYSASSPSFAFSTSGDMSQSGNARVPYTMAQWQEIERQNMIYKYMTGSVPVSPELLLPITTTPSNLPPTQSNSFGENGVSGSGSMDPEPWRCKRTDGKKWRCSRDVAPDQKYCERHSHKSRPRSRKPVELHANSSTQNGNYVLNTPYQSSGGFPVQSNWGLSVLPGALPSAYDQPRSSNWFLTGETVPDTSNSKASSWQYTNMDKNNNWEDQFNSNFYNLGGGQSWQARQLNNGCSTKSPSMEEAVSPRQETRHFIDAWSRDNSVDNCYVSSDKSMPLSSLNLTIYDGGRAYEEENENVQAVNGYGIKGLDQESVQWMSSPPGGPLAEALCLGMSSSDAKAGSNSARLGFRDCDNN